MYFLLQYDVVDDYMHLIGLADGEGLVRPGRSNPSLDAAGLEFLRRFNAHVPARRPWTARERGDVSAVLTDLSSDGPRLVLPPAQAREFVDRFAEGNARVAREYLGWGDGRLFGDTYPDPDSEQGVVGPGQDVLDVDRAVDLAAALWRAARQDLMPR